MGQFKPMVKMETTEPSVVLKLKKGGHVNMKKGGKAEAGHKKMAGGGSAMEMMMGTPALVGRPAVNAPVRAPGKPSMAARRKAMMAKPAMPAPSMAPPPMKKGGKAEGGESKGMHKAEMKAIKGVDSKLTKHASMAASKGHKGLETGGVVKRQGGYATGGITDGQGGYKMGGKTSKKAYATGGTVNSGRAVAMAQGAKKPSSPVSTNRVAGTFKKGGKVTPAESNLMKAFGAENKTAMKQAKAQSNDVYSKYQKMQGGGAASDKDKSFDSKPKEISDKASRELEDALNPLSMAKELYGRARNAFRGEGFMSDREKGMQSSPKGQGSVTKTEKSITVSPAGKKRGGMANC